MIHLSFTMSFCVNIINIFSYKKRNLYIKEIASIQGLSPIRGREDSNSRPFGP